jgi:hypothetical protein
MPVELLKPTYHCAMVDLYSVCETGWANYLKPLRLAEFTGFKGFYDAAFGAAALAKVAAARGLPDVQQRGAPAESYLVTLKQQGTVVRDDFGKLKRYIDSAFAPAFRKPEYEAAGQLLFDEGMEWDSIKELCTNMNEYITAKLAVLTANQNMPAAFQATVTADTGDFETTYGLFKTAEQTTAAANAKIAANNEIHKELMDMFKDGQSIYKRQPDIAKEFTFSVLLQMITPGSQGLRVKVMDGVNDVPVEGAEVEWKPEGEQPVSFVTLETGVAEKIQLGAKKGKVTVRKPGFGVVVQDAEVSAGTVHRITITLQPE